MPGKHITDQQVKKYMTEKNKHSQEIAAAKAGFSERTARRIDKGERQSKIIRTYRTRHNPLEDVWESVVVPMLKTSSKIKPSTIFEHLLDYHPNKFEAKHRRTLERHIRDWRHHNDDSKDVIFEQLKELGRLGILDYTYADYDVTIKGESFNHRLFHYRLPASGWAYFEVVYGGESFTSLATGLQNAFKASGGIPKELRTDSLSAAYKNNNSKAEFTSRFEDLATHYNFKPSTNNKGIAHENGAIESPNRHIKRRIEQALIVRGSIDFDSKDDYEEFILNVAARQNRLSGANERLIDEQRQLQSLPIFDSVNYEEHWVKVKSTSAIQINRVTYSVPSRLIGSLVRVHVTDKDLKIYLGSKLTLQLDRIFVPKKQKGYSIDYKHIIASLMKKPGAFRFSKWRDHILPNEDYKQIWKYIDNKLSMDEASHYMVRLLNLAKKSKREDAIGRFVLSYIDNDTHPKITECEEKFLPNNEWQRNPEVTQHDLSSYKKLLEGGTYVH